MTEKILRLTPWEAVRRLSALIEHDGHIVDIGAAHGEMAERLMRLAPGRKTVVADPLPINKKKLEKKFGTNPQVTIVNEAFADEEGTAEFNVGHRPATSSLYPRNQSGKAYYDPLSVMVETITVKTNRLDDYCEKNGIERIALLKLDTQGAESRILKGAENLLTDQRIDLIFTEWWAIPHYEGPPMFHELWAQLEKINYGVYDIYLGPRGEDGQLRYGDALFVSKEFRETRMADFKV